MTVDSGAAVFNFATNDQVISDPVNASAKDTMTAQAEATALVLTVAEGQVMLGDALLDITPDTLPVAGDAVHLYRRDMNINGTVNDAPEPDLSYENIFVGSFPLDLVAAQQFIPLPEIPLSSDQEFYIKFDLTAGGTGTNATVVYVRPKTYNAKV